MTKVLYVEHNDDSLYMLKTRLELRGDFEVLAAEDSETGCRLAATEPLWSRLLCRRIVAA